MDTDYIYGNLVKDPVVYEAYVKSVFEIYDLLEYSIYAEKCDSYEGEGILFFELESRLQSEGITIPLDQEFVALFHKPDGEAGGWKIQLIMRQDMFFMHQDNVYFLKYFDAVKDIVEDDLNKTEEYYEYVQEIKEIEKEHDVEGSYEDEADGSSSGSAFRKILFYVVLAVAAYLLWRYREQIKNNAGKALACLGPKAEEAYKKAYGENPTPYAYYAYDAAWLVMLGVLTSGKYDGDAVKTVLPTVGMHFVGATGQKMFDKNGDVEVPHLP
jgi:hypothetical protein